MKTIFLPVFLSMHLAASAAEAPAKLVLADGTTYESVKVNRVEPDGLSIRHSSGAAKIPFEKCTMATRKFYGFDPEKAAAFRRSQATSAAKAEAASSVPSTDVQEISAKEINDMRLAAVKGNADAQALLGLYYYGMGVPEDFDEAEHWSRKAAEQGNALGQFVRAMVYLHGKGVSKDDVEAYKWLLLTTGKGDGMYKENVKEQAKESIAIYEKNLTPEQIADGRNRARDFRPLKELDVVAAASAVDTKTQPAAPIVPSQPLPQQAAQTSINQIEEAQKMIDLLKSIQDLIGGAGGTRGQSVGLSKTDRLQMLRALRNANIITSIRGSEQLSDEEIIRLMGIYQQRQEQQRLRNLEAEAQRLRQQR